jgi:hypothetical protein
MSIPYTISKNTNQAMLDRHHHGHRFNPTHQRASSVPLSSPLLSYETVILGGRINSILKALLVLQYGVAATIGSLLLSAVYRSQYAMGEKGVANVAVSAV